jgi:GDSL-like Lipase/Acylhydrolase family
MIMRHGCWMMLLFACDLPRGVIVDIEGEGEGESSLAGEGEPGGEGEGERPVNGEGEGEPDLVVTQPARYLDEQSPMTDFVVDHLRAIRDAHPEMRNDVLAKVGDSLTVSTSYLQCFSGNISGNNINLGGRDLEDTRASFLTTLDSYRRATTAATVGWSASAVIAGNPSPLDDELTAISPGFATVMFGTNDVGYRSLPAFTADIVTIVDRMLDRGVVPLLSTIPPRDDDATIDARVPAYNLAIRAVAESRQVPFVDVGAALRGLPGHGIGADNIHLEQDSRGACILDDEGLQHGYNLRNMLVLTALDRVRRAVVDGEPALDGDGPAREGLGTIEAPFIIDALPFTASGDTSISGVRSRDVWSECSNADESGPEVYFQLTVTDPISVSVWALNGAGVDVDVHHVVEGLCQARSDVQLSLDLAAGVHTFVVDSYQGDALAGPFLLLAASL